MKKWHTGLILSVFMALLVVTKAGAVNYKLLDVEGKTQSLDQYKGKWLVVNYWATWCGTCMKELPELISFYENNKENDIEVVGINYENIDKERLKIFLLDNTIPYQILSSEPIKKTPLGPVPALPTTYIIDPQGEVVAGTVGIVTREDLENYIKHKKG